MIRWTNEPPRPEPLSMIAHLYVWVGICLWGLGRIL